MCIKSLEGEKKFLAGWLAPLLEYKFLLDGGKSAQVFKPCCLYGFFPRLFLGGGTKLKYLFVRSLILYCIQKILNIIYFIIVFLLHISRRYDYS